MTAYNDPRIDMFTLGPTIQSHFATVAANADRAEVTGYRLEEEQVSPAEIQLGAALIQAGIKDFTQQYQVGPYFADFFFPEGLVVEVDGAAYHDSDLDAQRDKRILKLGVADIVRIRAINVFRDPHACIEKIQAARERTRLG